jgi:hypothetical protein
MTDHAPHTISIELGDGGAYGVLVCPYEVTDATRPCWPYREARDDELDEEYLPDWVPVGPEEGTKVGCTWKEAWSDEGFDLVINTVTVSVPVKSFRWDGDNYEVELGEQP